MATLTAPVAARAAAQRLGLAPPPPSKPDASIDQPKPKPASQAAASRPAAQVKPPAAPSAAPEAFPAVDPIAAAETARAKSRERLAQQRVARDHLWPLLSTRFPEAFKLPPVPLAVGIHKQIRKIVGDDIDPAELGAFMRYWTMRQTYLMAVWRGEPRRNLDGTFASSPTINQRNDAGRKLWGDAAKPIVEAV